MDIAYQLIAALVSIWDILPLVMQLVAAIIVVISAIVAVVSFVRWLDSLRPKATQEGSVESYIDDTRQELIQMLKYKVSWGRIFFLNRMRLPEIPVASEVEVDYESVGGAQAPLEQDHWHYGKPSRVNSNGQGEMWKRPIELLGRQFFLRNQISHITLLVRCDTGLGYQTRISSRKVPGAVEILNANKCEVRNYRLRPPLELTLAQLKSDSPQLDSVRLEIPFTSLATVRDLRIGDCPAKGLLVEIVVESLPAERAGQKGRVLIEVVEDPTHS